MAATPVVRRSCPARTVHGRVRDRSRSLDHRSPNALTQHQVINRKALTQYTVDLHYILAGAMANAAEANTPESLVFSDSPGQPKAAPACSLLPGQPDRLLLQPAASADGGLSRVELAAAIRQNPGFREKVAKRAAYRAHSREAARSASSGGHSAENRAEPWMGGLRQ